MNDAAPANDGSTSGGGARGVGSGARGAEPSDADARVTAAEAVAGLDWRLGGSAGIAVGPTNSIADVSGIRIGHAQRVGDGWLTGVTVVLAEDGAVAAVDTRGGGTATRETAALDPSGVVERIQAVSLAGGSAFGLEAANGVMRVLRDRGLGFRVGEARGEVVPIVPAAGLFDLGRGGDFTTYPDGALGAEAALAALAAPVGVAPAQGVVGAGVGAITGEMKGGVGTASAVLSGGVVVAALVVVNADGTTVDPRTGAPWGLFAELPLPDGSGEYGIRTPSAAEHAAARARLEAEAARRPALRPLNTTLVVVATNAALDKAELSRLAATSHDGMARAVRPVHTLGDGDVVFALSTATATATASPDARPSDSAASAEAAAAESPPQPRRPGLLPEPAAGLLPDHLHSDSVNQVLTAGADVVTRAIVHAVLHAETVQTATATVPSYRDLYGQ